MPLTHVQAQPSARREFSWKDATQYAQSTLRLAWLRLAPDLSSGRNSTILSNTRSYDRTWMVIVQPWYTFTSWVEETC